jgi:hypothetical protein
MFEPYSIDHCIEEAGEIKKLADEFEFGLIQLWGPADIKREGVIRKLYKTAEQLERKLHLVVRSLQNK